MKERTALIEDQNTEFKRQYVDDIRKEVVAFANTDCGTIFIGIDDDGAVCGVDDNGKIVESVPPANPVGLNNSM